MFQRLLDLPGKNSFFLFGARGTGKTTLLTARYPGSESYFIDLLDPDAEEAFGREPRELERRVHALPASTVRVVVDEVQKVPRLLDLVHRLIETTPLQFVLTGSSGRKLRRGASNLLAGRAFVHNLYPLTHREIGPSFDLASALRWGTLPKVFQFTDPEDRNRFLRSYALTYFQEEIRAEQVVRRLDPFRQFLEVAAQSNARILNFSKIAEDVGVDTKTVQSYFTILEDTLVGSLLPAYHASVRKRQRKGPKFYYFDTGVRRALERTLTVDLREGTYAFGEAFEHFVILEIMRLSTYAANDWRFSYLKTDGEAEIDLIVERPGMPKALVAIKSTDRVGERDVSALNRFLPALRPAEAFCLSRDPNGKKIGAVWCLPWQEGIARLGL
jgi:predicted AAA+ superfamily ATPase